jgi:hypothetical protein
MGIQDNAAEILEGFRKHCRFFEEGDLTAAEVVNGVLLKLAESQRFDLVEETVRLLPVSVAAELRRTIEEILRPNSGYKAPVIIGRASREWEARIRRDVRHLAERFSKVMGGHVPSRREGEVRGNGT